MKFAHKDLVEVSNGFWRGKKGIIVDVKLKEVKDSEPEVIGYVVEFYTKEHLENKVIAESDLKPRKKSMFEGISNFMR